MQTPDGLQGVDPAFRLMIATSWLAPESWRLNQEEAIRQAVEAALDWTKYLFLVDRHRIPALSWASLDRVPGIAIPPQVKQELKKRSNDCRMQAVRHCLLLADVLKGFAHEGIPAMPCKGPLLSGELYGDVGLRHSKDLDLAVMPDDVFRARLCLEKLGWQMDSTVLSMTPRQWRSFLEHEPHLGFIHSASGAELELHWRNWWETPELTRAQWARSVPSAWQKCSFRALNPIDTVIYLCGHGGEHFWARAKWLGDLARIHAMGQVDWKAALAEAHKTAQERVILAGLQLLNHLYGLPLPSLPGALWAEMPPLLVEIPVESIKESQEPDTGQLWSSFRHARYERLLRPRKTWRESITRLLYHREDFKTVPLSDCFFWLYVPLRPVLWAWRRFRKLRLS